MIGLLIASNLWLTNLKYGLPTKETLANNAELLTSLQFAKKRSEKILGRNILTNDLKTFSEKQTDNPFFRYLRKKTPEFHWTQTPNGIGRIDFKITTQKWHGVVWNQDLIWLNADSQAFHPPMPGDLKHGAILYVTGDNPDDADIQDAWNLSKLAGLPVATLFNEPVQPLFGLEEDPLIAFTFQQYLKTGDSSWPLLFPMVKGVRQAMTAIDQATHHQINRFMVFGNSKRGWTSWLAGATGDQRIVGIAPTSFDMLNFGAQLSHQINLWGHYSPMFEPYEKAGLLPLKKGAKFERLMKMVDPISYAKNLHCRVFDIRGTNDPFWAVDAHNYYSSSLPSENWTLALPNEGHDFKDKKDYFQAIAAFARMCFLPPSGAYHQEWPNIWARLGDTPKGNLSQPVPNKEEGENSLKIEVHSSIRPEELRLFYATSKDGNFANSKWDLAGLVSPSDRGSEFVYKIDLPSISKGVGAWYVIAKYILPEGGMVEPIQLSTPIELQFPSR